MTDVREVKRYCKIVNKYGLHTRSAAAIVQLANQYSCEITLSTEKGDSEALDMLRLMLLEASIGTSIGVAAQGDQAEEAVSAMISLIEAGFNEQDD